MTANLNANVPLINVPFVDLKTGMVTESWFLFLIQLFQRTGGSSGTTPTTLTIADILSVEETFAAVAPKDKNLAFEETFAQPTVMSKISEMIFAPIVATSSSGSGWQSKTYSSGTDFTPGTTTSLPLPGSVTAGMTLLVFFDATYQGSDQYTVSGTTLTFSSAIPVGTQKVYVLELS